MAKTKKANWEKAIELLKEKGVDESTIQNAINDKTDNRAKYNALKPFLKEYNVSVDTKVDEENVNTIFGRLIGKLLIERYKEEQKMKKGELISITDLREKRAIDLTAKELDLLRKRKDAEIAKANIKKIETQLQKYGIRFLSKEEIEALENNQ